MLPSIIVACAVSSAISDGRGISPLLESPRTTSRNLMKMKQRVDEIEVEIVEAKKLRMAGDAKFMESTLFFVKVQRFMIANGYVTLPENLEATKKCIVSSEQLEAMLRENLAGCPNLIQQAEDNAERRYKEFAELKKKQKQLK